MSYTNNTSRLTRLTALLLKLQTKAFFPIQELGDHFEVSKRTMYRDLSDLERSGVPIVSEEGKGYGLMKGYHLPPVMFSESEANALMLAEKMIHRETDASFIQEFTKAIDKVRAVLGHEEKEKAALLSQRTVIGKNWDKEITSNYLIDIQHALTHFQLVNIHYQKAGSEETTQRDIEPFAIYHNTLEKWVIIALCRLRKDFRTFRIDRIRQLTVLDIHFSPHEMSLQAYTDMQREKIFGGRDKGPSQD